jgi:hypothetical protein
MTGISFTSGADQALFFDELKFERDSVNWRRLVTRGSQLALFGGLCATLIGGVLQHSNPRLPWILTGASLIILACIIWVIKDTRPRIARQMFKAELSAYLNDIKQGFRSFGTTKLRMYVPIILTVQGLFYATDFGLLRIVLLSRFHFSPLAGSVIIAGCSLISVGVLAWMHRYATTLSEKHVISTIAIAAAASLLLALLPIGLWGFVVVLVLYVSEQALSPFISETLNYHTSENQRATVLSVASFLKSIPYVLLGPVIGSLNTHDHLEYFLMIWAVLIGTALVLYLALKKRDTKISLSRTEARI